MTNSCFALSGLGSSWVSISQGVALGFHVMPLQGLGFGPRSFPMCDAAAALDVGHVNISVG